MDCGQVDEIGDSVDGWVLAVPQCAEVLVRKDGDAPVGPCAEGEVQCGSECADLQSSQAHCGECDNACSGKSQHPFNKVGVCVEGQCVEQCWSTAQDCDDDPATCETPVDSLDNCGACGNACTAPAGSTALCISEMCLVECTGNLLDCDGDTSNGCETSRNDPRSCGSCDVACQADPDPPANQQPACENGQCTFACKEGFADCGGSTETCETDTRTDNNHCGACDTPCAGTCMDGTCT